MDSGRPGTILTSRFGLAALLLVSGGACDSHPADRTAAPSPAKIEVGLTLMKVHSRLVPMWNTDIPQQGPSSFSRMNVREELKRFILTQLREDQQRGGRIPIDTRYSADFPKSFRQMRYVRAAMIHPRNHRYSGFHVVLANQTAVDGWGEKFPEGSVIVKLIFPAIADEQDNLFQGEMESIWSFQKDSARFPKEHGGWGFEVFDLYNKTRLITRKEHAAWCHGCHSKAKNEIIYSPDPASIFALPARFESKPFRFSPYQTHRTGRLP